MAQAISHPNSIAAAEFFLTIVHILQREVLLVQQSAERVIAYSTEHGLGGWLLFAPQHRAWAMSMQGHYHEGLAQLLQGISIQHQVGADIGRSQMLCLLAEAYSRAGRFDEALSTLAEALAAVEAQAEHYYEPEVYRLKGELLLRRASSNVVEAQSCFERGIAISLKQSSESLELRATTSLARLLEKQDRREEARTMLAEIYNWFTEGFDTADLKDAKALLDELSG